MNTKRNKINPTSKEFALANYKIQNAKWHQHMVNLTRSDIKTLLRKGFLISNTIPFEEIFLNLTD